MARAPGVGEKVPSASEGRVGPQIGPTVCLGEGRAGRSESSCLLGCIEAHGHRPPAPPLHPSPGRINIYLWKAKVNPEEFLQDPACLLGDIAVKGNLTGFSCATWGLMGKGDFI